MQVKLERRPNLASLKGTLSKNGRCPVCTLLPPCNHYKSQLEILQINEVGEDLEQTVQPKDDLVLPKLSRNMAHAMSVPNIHKNI